MSIHGDHPQTPVSGASWNDGLHFLMQQCKEDSEKWFPEAQSLTLQTLCLAGEVGEIANIVKKVERGTLRMEDAMETLPEEVVDVLIYLLNLMTHDTFKDVKWMELWYAKRKYNEMRFAK